MAAAPDLALIGHLESAEDYATVLSAARGDDLRRLRAAEVRPLLREMEPMPLCDLVLHSSRGRSVQARYVELGLIVEDDFDLARALRKVKAACAHARDMGARLGTLGGFSSIVGEAAGMDLAAEFGLPFTTGNTLTAAVIAEQVRRLPIRLEDSTVAIVGAGGDVGSGVSRILARRGVRLLLVGRTRWRLERLRAELPGSRVGGWEEAGPRPDVVVLVASAAQGAVALDGVPSTSFVLDAGHPPNATGRRPRYAVAGRVSHEKWPMSDLPAVLSSRYAPGEAHACLAEGEVLALEGRWEGFSGRRGLIVPERAAEILALAESHGIRPAPLRFAPP